MEGQIDRAALEGADLGGSKAGFLEAFLNVGRVGKVSFCRPQGAGHVAYDNQMNCFAQGRRGLRDLHLQLLVVKDMPMLESAAGLNFDRGLQPLNLDAQKCLWVTMAAVLYGMVERYGNPDLICWQ